MSSMKRILGLRTSGSWSVYVACCQQLKGNTRALFSKTGVWDPQLWSETKKEIEQHWQPLIKEYDKEQAERVTRVTREEHSDQERFYALSMFPYPSGNLHLGHVRVYTISDVMARYQRSKGKLVVHPMGWDAFGLPAENAAIERNINPKDWTYSNIATMRKQLQSMGFSFDWTREIATCDPSYYKWTQWLFLKMYEHGLAFQKKGKVNWDPVDQTVLAHAQIDEQGRSWRSGAKVEVKYLTQWFLRDTVFSKSLLDGLDEVDPTLWKDIIAIQKNWISECAGHRVDFVVVQADVSSDFPLSIYTENLDLIHGVSHISVSPTHFLAVEAGLTEEGAVLPVRAINPVTQESVNIIVTSEKNMDNGRDIELGIPSVSAKDAQVAQTQGWSYREVLDADGRLINSEELFEVKDFTREEALQVMTETAKNQGFGGEQISKRLYDWLISRQRYWGTPIPIIHCPKCKAVPVPYDQLPVILPDTETIVSKGGRSPMEEEGWRNVPCPKCKGPAQRETDTMDTFVDSCWYFLRYLDPHNDLQPFDPDVVNKFMPVNLYVGGKEHAVLHLYFARFMCHFLHSIGLLKTREPFTNLLPQGIVKARTYKVKATGSYLDPADVDASGKVAVNRLTGEELVVEWEKMSKSKHNGVNPQEVLDEYGIDATRLCILSNVSPMTNRNWNLEVFKGVNSWQRNMWNLISVLHGAPPSKQTDMLGLDEQEWEARVDVIRNHAVNRVTIQFEQYFSINAGISELHKMVTLLNKVPASISVASPAYERAVGELCVFIGVMAPHFASEMWAGLRAVRKSDSHAWDKSVLDQPWPKVDGNFMVPMSVSVNTVSITQVGVAHSSLGSLDEATAVDLVSKDDLFIKRFGDYTIMDKKFMTDHQSRASIELKIPDYVFEELGSELKGSALKKMKRKLGSERKKLRTL